jgi:preprotein translocase subunit SecG
MPKEVKWAISFLAGGVLLWIGWRLYFVLVSMHVIICLILIGVILLQSGEAADLAGAFGGSGSQTAFGPRGAATFLSRATTWCAVMFMLTSMLLAVHVQTTSAGSGRSVLEQFSKPAPKSAPAQPGAPALPAIPGQQAVPPAPAPAQSAPPAQPTQPALPSAPPAQAPPGPAAQ